MGFFLRWGNPQSSNIVSFFNGKTHSLGYLHFRTFPYSLPSNIQFFIHTQKSPVANNDVLKEPSGNLKWKTAMYIMVHHGTSSRNAGRFPWRVVFNHQIGRLVSRVSNGKIFIIETARPCVGSWVWAPSGLVAQKLVPQVAIRGRQFEN